METGNPELIDGPIFIIAAKFTYYSVNYAAVGKCSSENNLPAVAVSTRLAHLLVPFRG